MKDRIFMRDKERRLVAVPVSSTYLIDMMREGFQHADQYRCVAGVPKDAVMVSDYFDYMTQRAMIIFYHPSFEIVADGCMLPVLNVVYERIVPSDNTLIGRLKSFIRFGE